MLSDGLMADAADHFELHVLVRQKSQGKALSS
jgi:hypothetical protein